MSFALMSLLAVLFGMPQQDRAALPEPNVTESVSDDGGSKSSKIVEPLPWTPPSNLPKSYSLQLPARFTPPGALDGNCPYSHSRRGETPDAYARRHRRGGQTNTADLDCLFAAYSPSQLGQYAQQNDVVAIYALAVADLPEYTKVCTSQARGNLNRAADLELGKANGEDFTTDFRFPDPSYVLGYIAEICGDNQLSYQYFRQSYYGGLIGARFHMIRMMRRL
jgi:hypothetical protein